jgi:phosphonate transport system permease protein
VLTTIYGAEDWTAMRKGAEEDAAPNARPRGRWRRSAHDRARPYPTRWRRPPQILKHRGWRIAICRSGSLIWLVLALSTIDPTGRASPPAGSAGCASSAGSCNPTSPRAGATSKRADRKPDDDADLDRGRHPDLGPHRHRRRAQPGAALDLHDLPRHHRASRALQEIIVAIFFVAMFGFGPFAGS